MTTRVLISFFCDDRPGVIKQLSQAVDECQGNWLDSQLSRLGGRFAGVLQVHLPKVQVDPLREKLASLAADGITATLTEAGDAPASSGEVHTLALLGSDRSGIVYELTSALISEGYNVLTMDTHVEAAPMSGEPLFSARARVELPPGRELADLGATIDALGESMTLDIHLSDDDIA